MAGSCIGCRSGSGGVCEMLRSHYGVQAWHAQEQWADCMPCPARACTGCSIRNARLSQCRKVPGCLPACLAMHQSQTCSCLSCSLAKPSSGLMHAPHRRRSVAWPPTAWHVNSWELARLPHAPG